MNPQHYFGRIQINYSILIFQPSERTKPESLHSRSAMHRSNEHIEPSHTTSHTNDTHDSPQIKRNKKWNRRRAECKLSFTVAERNRIFRFIRRPIGTEGENELDPARTWRILYYTFEVHGVMAGQLALWV